MLKTVDSLLPLAKLPAEEREQIRKDVAALAADLKTLIPDAGAMMGLSFLTDRGFEELSLFLGRQPMLDGSQPLASCSTSAATPPSPPSIAARSRWRTTTCW